MGSSSSKIGPSGSETSLRLRQMVATAVEMQYPMWLCPVSKFVKLSKLEPHQVMRARGDLVMWDPRMKAVFFASHQWTSFDHPDPTLEQLRTFQRLLIRMMKGEVADTKPDFGSQLVLKDSAVVTTKQWKDLVQEAYIWVDYMSVPQIGTYHQTPLSGLSDLMKAVESIPAYVEKASHFFAVTPTVSHADLPDVTCNYGSWLRRGWCRLEMMSLLLSRFNELPVIVVQGPEAQPFMIAACSILSRPAGEGEFTCCARNHKIRDPVTGAMSAIPCDRSKIGPVVWTLLRSKIEYLESAGSNSLTEFRMWNALLPHLMRRLPIPAEDFPTVSESQRHSVQSQVMRKPSTVDDFLRLYRFETAHDEEGKQGDGLTPLFYSVMSGNVDIACALIKKHKVDVHTEIREAIPRFALTAGATALYAAASFCPGHEATMVQELLHAGACINHRTKDGITPLMGSSIYQSLNGLNALLGASPKYGLDIELGIGVNNATALELAATAGTVAIVEALIKAGANRAAIQDHGGTVLHAACMNPDVDHRMLTLILGTDGKVDVNAAYRPRNKKWLAIDYLFETLYRFGDRSNMTMDLAHTRGSTALHVAAQFGAVHVVEWLLAHGANDSLRIKNKSGATPLDTARIFGPHPEIESLVSAAMLEHSFNAKYKVRKGSLMLNKGDSGKREHEVQQHQATATSTEMEAGAAGDEGDSAEREGFVHTSAHHRESDEAGGGSSGVVGSDADSGGVLVASELVAQLDALQQSAMQKQESAMRDMAREQERRMAALEEGLHSRLDAVLERLSSGRAQEGRKA